MFIEAFRSAVRTPAGCYVGRSLNYEVNTAHCTPLGCGSRADLVSINIAPLRGAFTQLKLESRGTYLEEQRKTYFEKKVLVKFARLVYSFHSLNRRGELVR